MKSKFIALTGTVKDNADMDVLFGVYYGGIVFALILTLIGGLK
jgi:orotate phosphoribosyltransferase